MRRKHYLAVITVLASLFCQCQADHPNANQPRSPKSLFPINIDLPYPAPTLSPTTQLQLDNSEIMKQDYPWNNDNGITKMAEIWRNDNGINRHGYLWDNNNGIIKQDNTWSKDNGITRQDNTWENKNGITSQDHTWEKHNEITGQVNSWENSNRIISQYNTLNNGNGIIKKNDNDNEIKRQDNTLDTNNNGWTSIADFNNAIQFPDPAIPFPTLPWRTPITSYVEKSPIDPGRFQPRPIPLRNQQPSNRIDEFHIFHQMPSPHLGQVGPGVGQHPMMGQMGPGVGQHPMMGQMGPGVGQHPMMGQQHPGSHMPGHAGPHKGHGGPSTPATPPRPPPTTPKAKTFHEFFERNFETTPENVYLFIGLTIWTIYLRARGEDVTFMTPIFPYLRFRRRRSAGDLLNVAVKGGEPDSDVDPDVASVVDDRLLLEGLRRLTNDSTCTWRAACEVPDRTRVFVDVLDGAREVAQLLNLASSTSASLDVNLGEHLRRLADEGEGSRLKCQELYQCEDNIILSLIADLKHTAPTIT